MGRWTTATVAELSEGWVLSPERYDARRDAALATEQTLGALVEIVPTTLTSKDLSGPVLVLDTTHAWEGFVLYKHAVGQPADLGSARKRLLPGDVIVSRLRPYLRQVAWVDDALFSAHPDGNAVVASPEFYVLRRRGELDPAALIPWLLSPPVQELLAAAQEGGHHPRVPLEVLQGLVVPADIVATADATGTAVRAAVAGMRSAVGAMTGLQRP